MSLIFGGLRSVIIRIVHLGILIFEHLSSAMELKKNRSIQKRVSHNYTRSAACFRSLVMRPFRASTQAACIDVFLLVRASSRTLPICRTGDVVLRIPSSVCIVPVNEDHAFPHERIMGFQLLKTLTALTTAAFLPLVLPCMSTDRHMLCVVIELQGIKSMRVIR
jgi:hypothetical protein